MWEDAEPKKPKRIEVGEDLERFSVAELHERAEALEAEVKRVREKIAAKGAAASAAQSVFKP